MEELNVGRKGVDALILLAKVNGALREEIEFGRSGVQAYAVGKPHVTLDRLERVLDRLSKTASAIEALLEVQK